MLFAKFIMEFENPIKKINLKFNDLKINKYTIYR